MYIANRVTREIYSMLDQINQIFRSFAFIQNKKEEEKIKREREKKMSNSREATTRIPSHYRES